MWPTFAGVGKWERLKACRDPLPSPFFHQYSTVEEAVATRTALHGVKWPQSNPKFLCADYAEQDEVRNQGKGSGGRGQGRPLSAGFQLRSWLHCSHSFFLPLVPLAELWGFKVCSLVPRLLRWERCHLHPDCPCPSTHSWIITEASW